MVIAHIGIGLLILGITGSSVWQKEKIIRMQINDETKIEKYNIIFENIDEVKGPNYLAIQGNFLVYDGIDLFSAISLAGGYLTGANLSLADTTDTDFSGTKGYKP